MAVEIINLTFFLRIFWIFTTNCQFELLNLDILLGGRQLDTENVTPAHCVQKQLLLKTFQMSFAEYLQLFD